jgi:hypothetical protein
VERLSTPEYMTLLAEQGIGGDPRYPGADQLSFTGSGEEAWRTIDLPTDPRELGPFVRAVLAAAAPTAAAFAVFPRQAGTWPVDANSALGGDVIAVVARGAGVPADFVGAVRLDRTEPALIALVAAALAFGQHTGDDLYVIPADGQCILMTDHHAQLVADFPTLAERDEFTLRLGPTGFDSDAVGPPAHDRAV